MQIASNAIYRFYFNIIIYKITNEAMWAKLNMTFSFSNFRFFYWNGYGILEQLTIGRSDLDT